MDRRKFLIKGGAATAALITSTSVLANIGNPYNSKKINIGIIGTGQRGAGLIPFINEIENLNVYACCDTIPFRLEKGLARTNGSAIGYNNYKDLLNDKDVDAVLVATPFNAHSQIAIDAVDAGKHVYCEKTLAKGYDGIRNLVAKVKTSEVIFQTGHQYHSSRLYTHVVKLIKEGKVGNISAFECQWNRHGNWRRPVPDPSLEKAINWRMYKEFSGGLVAELCSHQIDFVNTILEENPLQVMGTGGVDYWKDGRETYDNIHLIYNYPNGVEAKFTCLTTNAKEGYQIKVIGDKGTMIITTNSAKFYPEGIKNRKVKAKKQQDVDGVSGATWQKDDEGYGEPIQIKHDNPSKQALLDFRDSILDSKEPVSNVVTGAKAAVCVQMGLDAMYNNKIIEWDSKFEVE
ncbi:Gfo/Idh/MocA family oxidoreductase [Algibacter aquimarinus]|uniref:Gfo/Idh/MocA family oxidoreductase n=1 Tax=Algibacter aquimarinus TaxID=1136748 RepID=A0ABP9H031_9FLAO